MASEGYMRAFQMSNRENKNCSELLKTNGMGLDGAPVKFLTLVFLEPPKLHHTSAEGTKSEVNLVGAERVS